MNLVIDLGNTSAKIAFFKNGHLEALYRDVSFEDIISHIQKYIPDQAIICSVNQQPSLLEDALKKHIKRVYVLDHQLPVPVINHYQTPQTLGKDRLAAVCGAKTIYPEVSCLVIDMGTCITYDYINAASHYLGGNIAPGLYMRFQSLHTFTSRLPLVEPVPEINLIGRNTKEAILSGVINGMAAEIEGIIKEFKNKFGYIHVIFCGGDAKFFESKIKEPIFVIPELVLIGLNRILEDNVSTI